MLLRKIVSYKRESNRVQSVTNDMQCTPTTRRFVRSTQALPGASTRGPWTSLIPKHEFSQSSAGRSVQHSRDHSTGDPVPLKLQMDTLFIVCCTAMGCGKSWHYSTQCGKPIFFFPTRRSAYFGRSTCKRGKMPHATYPILITYPPAALCVEQGLWENAPHCECSGAFFTTCSR